MDDELRALADRVRSSLTSPAERAAHDRLLALVRQDAARRKLSRRDLARQGLTGTGGGAAREELARMLVVGEQPLWAREIAAFALGCAGDRRAFEPLVLLLNYRDPVKCATAARALARLGDPRTARAAAALATNPLRTAYALHPVRLLAELRAPESVPALIATLERLLAARDHYWPIARACVEGLGALADRRAVPVLTAAREHERLRAAAEAAIAAVLVARPRQPGERSAATGRRPAGPRPAGHGPARRAARDDPSRPG